MEGIDETIKTKKKITYSDLYGKLLENNISHQERFLLAKIIKSLAICDTVDIPITVWGESIYIDLNEKETRDNF